MFKPEWGERRQGRESSIQEERRQGAESSTEEEVSLRGVLEGEDYQAVLPEAQPADMAEQLFLLPMPIDTGTP